MSNGTLSKELLAALLARGGSPDQAVAKGLRRLSALFTVERDALHGDYLAEPALRRAYLLYFLPVNLAKVAGLLQEMPALPSRPVRILDLGSGPGAASLAMLDHLAGRGDPAQSGSEVVAVDRGREALQDAEFLWTHVTTAYQEPPACAFRPVTFDLERSGSKAPWKGGPYDLIILANCLNELFHHAADPIARRVKLLERLLEALAVDGTLMIIEPALRETTRALHQTRDRIVAQGLATVYSPCLHDRPCPALAHPADWCHEERPWSPPAMVQGLDHIVGFIKDALKFSYVLLRKDGRTIAERNPAVYRVVSEVMAMKGEQRAWLCNETGRPLVGRLDKARSEANAAFDAWHRGAIVRVDQIERRGTVGRIGSSTRVELIRPIS